MFARYLTSLHKSILTESVWNAYSVLLEANIGDAYKYFDKEVRNVLNPSIQAKLKADVLDLVKENNIELSDTVSWVKVLFRYLIADFNLRDTEAIYFVPGLARILFNNLDEFEYEPDTGLSAKADRLGELVKYIAIGHKDNYTRYLCNRSTGEQETFESLNEKYRDAFMQAQKADLERLKTMDYTPTDYKIVELTSFKVAHQYAQYATAQEWCHLEYPDMFDHYSEGGTIRLYLALKPGFEKLRPGDKGYGNSMLGIDIGPNNQLKNCNNRYNHDPDPELDKEHNSKADKRYNAEELSLLLGGPYYEFCPYYSREEMARRGILDMEQITQLINSGVDPKEAVPQQTAEVFYPEHLDKSPDGYKYIVIHSFSHRDKSYHNILTSDHKLLFDEWQDNLLTHPHVVEIQRQRDYNPEYNLVDYTTGKLLLDPWAKAIASDENYNNMFLVMLTGDRPLKTIVLDEYGKPIPGLEFDAVIRIVLRHNGSGVTFIQVFKKIPGSTASVSNLLMPNSSQLLLDNWVARIDSGLDDQIIAYTSYRQSNEIADIYNLDGTKVNSEPFNGVLTPNDAQYKGSIGFYELQNSQGDIKIFDRNCNLLIDKNYLDKESVRLLISHGINYIQPLTDKYYEINIFTVNNILDVSTHKLMLPKWCSIERLGEQSNLFFLEDDRDDNHQCNIFDLSKAQMLWEPDTYRVFACRTHANKDYLFVVRRGQYYNIWLRGKFILPNWATSLDNISSEAEFSCSVTFDPSKSQHYVLITDDSKEGFHYLDDQWFDEVKRVGQNSYSCIKAGQTYKVSPSNNYINLFND